MTSIKTKHIKYVANGQGAQSILLCVQSGEGKFPCDVWLAADTGEEKDRVLNSGERISAKEYFKEVTLPLSRLYGIPAFLIRRVTAEGKRISPIMEYSSERRAATGSLNISMPLFTISGGQLRQSCTDKWKVAAMKQKLRRLGAKTAHAYQGIHWDEAARRVKGIFLHTKSLDFDLDVYQSIEYDLTLTSEEFAAFKIKPPLVREHCAWDSKRQIWKVPKIVRWTTHSYPLVDQRIGRQQAREELEKRKIPYVVSSECDCCPHKDLSRWLLTSESRLNEIAEFEKTLIDERGRAMYLTPERKPLLVAIENMKAKALAAGRDPFEDANQFGCGSDNNVCFV